MKKSDLKTGMVAKLRRGDICVVLLNTEIGDIFSKLDDYFRMGHYTELLENRLDYMLDVMEVFCGIDIGPKLPPPEALAVVWTREIEPAGRQFRFKKLSKIIELCENDRWAINGQGVRKLLGIKVFKVPFSAITDRSIVDATNLIYPQTWYEEVE